MLNLSDKELDRLSREAAGQYEIDENISSWEKLEQQLDKEIGNFSPVPPPRSPWMTLSYVSLIMLLACFSFYLLRSKKNNIKDIAQKSSSHVVAAVKISGVASKSKDQKNAEEVPINSKNNSLPGKDAKGNIDSATNRVQTPGQNTGVKNSDGMLSGDTKAKASSIAPAFKSIDTRSNNPSKELSNSNSSKGHPVVQNKQKDENRDLGKNRMFAFNNKTKKPAGQGLNVNHLAKNNKPGDQQLLTETPSQNPESQNQTQEGIYNNQTARHGGLSGKREVDDPEASILPQIQALDLPRHQISDASLRALGAGNQSLIAGSPAPAAKKAALRINRSLHIGILFAPDFTNVGSANNDKMSTNAGLAIGYHFFRNFSINTGFILTRKNYAANGYDFHPPSNSWINNSNTFHLNFVQGTCNMMEIPLTLRYDYTTIGKTTFFLDGGLSSYLMRNESYKYFYYYYGNSSSVKKGYNDHENYLFSTVSLSIGIEQQIRKNLSIQVEPFVKLPLSGVGYGNLQLTSYGLSFSVWYSPVLGRSRR